MIHTSPFATSTQPNSPLLSYPNDFTSDDIDTTENKLREAFGEFGTVTDVFLPMERNTQRPRGFGFVSLAGRAAAEAAIAKMDQAQLDNRTIRVNESRPRGEQGADGGRGPGGRGGFNSSGRPEVKLYVGNLSFDTSEDQVRDIFGKFGEVTDCFLPTDRETGKVRGFAFVTMKSSDAEKACMDMNGQEIDGRTLKVNEAQPKGATRGGGGGGYGEERGGTSTGFDYLLRNVEHLSLAFSDFFLSSTHKRIWRPWRWRIRRRIQ